MTRPLFVLLMILLPISIARGQRGNRSGSAAKIPASKLPEAVRKPAAVEMEVAAVISGRRGEVRLSAEEIDHRVEDKLRRIGIDPHPLADDDVFLRRVYLDVAGRIPTYDEAIAFLESNEPDRREQLIDDLLSSPDYVSNFYNFWADNLRLVQKPQSNIVAEPYLTYVKHQIRENRPYDQWVYEMLTADGKIWDNPATGYQLRDQGMPLPYIDNTVRVFLGTQIGCAQCHDHPFDSWSQYQFYELAAFTAGTRTRTRPPEGAARRRGASDLIKQSREMNDGRSPGYFQRVMRANTYAVSEIPTKLRLPHDYAYGDAKPGDEVNPAVLWGEIPQSAAAGTPREQFAAWLTSADNPRFKRTIANRIWKRLLGVGLIEPIDDLRDDSECANEELLDFLADELVRLNFDLKELVRTILYSKTYQRQADDYQLTSGDMYYFPGPTVRRMTAEQVWDSLLTLAAYNPWAFQRPGAEDYKPNIELDVYNASMAEAQQVAQKFSETYYSSAYRRAMNDYRYKGNVMVRASEQMSPLPPEHFLRQFGQGDRETINGQDDSATVPQILAMFNGPITHAMLETGSVIYDNVASSANPKEAVQRIFISVLAREPSREDLVHAVREVNRDENRGIGLGNVIWALLNTREFLFIQ